MLCSFCRHTTPFVGVCLFLLPCREGHLTRSALSLLQPYQPSLSAAWMFQRSMALKRGQLRQTHHTPGGRPTRQEGWVPPSQINRLLSCNFAVMQVGSGSVPPCLLIPLAFDRASSLPKFYLAQPPAIEQVEVRHLMFGLAACDRPGCTDGRCATLFWQHTSRAAL